MTIIYPIVSDRYFQYTIKNNGNQIHKPTHLLTGEVFEESEDILNKKDEDHIDRLTWNNKGDNITWATPTENKKYDSG
jgi:hypothetical protein